MSNGFLRKIERSDQGKFIEKYFLGEIPKNKYLQSLDLENISREDLETFESSSL